MDPNISEFRIEQIKARSKKEFISFSKIIKRHYVILAFVLYSHLYIESLLDEIIKIYLSDSKKVTEMRFLDKVNFVYSISVVNNEEYKKIRAINDIRNKFAHNLHYRLSKKDLIPLIEGLKVNKSNPIKRLLTAGTSNITGHLIFTREIGKYYPFAMNILLNNKRYSKDKVFKNLKNSIKKEINQINFEKWRI